MESAEGVLPNLKGAAIGNGCNGNGVGLCSGASAYEQRIDAEIFSGHGMISLGLYRTIGAACPTIADGYTAQPSADCLELYTAMNAQTGSFDVYNVYDQCPDTGVSVSAGAVRDGRTRALEGLLSEGWSSNSMADSLHPTPPLNTALGGALNDWACGGMEAMNVWLGRADVQQALHVSGHGNNSQTYRSLPSTNDLRPLYKRLAKKYRMLIYSGEVDSCVPYYASEDWTSSMGFAVRQPWTAWHSPSLDAPNKSTIRAGYCTEYHTGNASNPRFTFLTVAGSGHMVPKDKAPQALSMIRTFLANGTFA